MAAATRPRGFLDLTMPPGSSDKSQPPMGSGFPGANLYPNRNIWTSSLSNARERSIGSKDTDESPSGSSALAANSEAEIWTSNPWNKERPQRSVSTSPNRTRDGPLSSGSGAFYDHGPSTIGMKKGSFGNAFQDDAAGFNSAFTSQKRTAGPDASYLDSLNVFPQAREQPMPPPSRQSQGSPAFQDVYRGHTPSSSIHSQRHLGTQATAYASQSTNQRAYNMNKQVDEDFGRQFSRRVGVDTSSVVPGGFNPPTQPFQLNPGSQPWLAENASSRYGNNMDLSGVDHLATQFAAMKRPSVDRISPASGYRFEEGNSPRNYTIVPDGWAGRPSSRDPRSNSLERRGSGQQYAANYAPSYYTNPYHYGNVGQYAPPNFVDPYGQNFRHPMLPGYGLPPVPSGYAGPASQPPVRPSRDQDPAKGARSVLLDEFRLSNKSSKRYELRDIYNHVVEFSGDQHGSRFIQLKLESANSDEKDQIFREIEPNSIQLMKDVFGNYVVQKFFEHGNQVQKKILAEKMKGKVVDLSVQVYACRVVQKALEHVLVEQQAELTRELEPEIMRVIRDQNGNHVVQKVIELVPRQYIGFVMNALRGQVTVMAGHTYGCRVIQRMLEHGSEQDKAEIMKELHDSAQMLITDQYGNYVAQHVIENGKPEDRDKLINLVLSQLLTMSKHKFASNVVEKCIKFGTPEHRTSIRLQLTAAGNDGTAPLGAMMRDQFGNYVVQTLLDFLHGTEKELLVEEIRPQFFALKKNGTSRQVQALEKHLGMGAGSAGARNESGPGPFQGDGTSAADTPALTNETSSPQSSSPRSSHAGAVGLSSVDGTTPKASHEVSGDLMPRVGQEGEA